MGSHLTVIGVGLSERVTACVVPPQMIITPTVTAETEAGSGGGKASPL